jgi:hypothetical protein
LHNRRIAKQTAIHTVEGIRKRGRPRKIWRGDVEEDLNTVGIKEQVGNGQRSSGMEENFIGSQGQQ